MNIHPISNGTWKARMEEIESPIVKVSTDTMNEALQKEKQATEADGENGVKFSYDAGWQQRGSGRCYNSASGKYSFI